MSRRAVFLIALVTLGLLATAVVPWTLSSGGLAAAVGQQLRKTTGLELTVAGRSTIAFLPVPRVKFEDITLTSADGTPVVRGGTLRGELRLVRLLFGSADLREVALSGSRIEVASEAWGATGWNTILAFLRRETDPRRAAGPQVRRLILNNVTVARQVGGLHQADDTARTESETAGQAGVSDDDLQDVSLLVNWPSADASAEVMGTFMWRGERIAIERAAVRPAALVAQAPTPFELVLNAAIGRVSLSGEAQTGDDPRAQGRGLVEIRSPRDLFRWSGVELPLSRLLPSVAVGGEFTADRHGVAWPSVVLTLGADRLEGALSVRYEGDRPLVAGTLAADRLELSDFFAPFWQARTPAGLWSTEPLSLTGVTGGDLDLRLSATDARIGRLRLDDMAASILVRRGRIEASLGRATVHRGVLKGRIGLGDTSDGTDLKLQGSFEGVDGSALLSDLGQPRWLAGQAQGQVTLEGAGATVADLVRQVHGRVLLTMRHGELIGISLDDVLRRVEKRPLTASLEWKGGRTSFDQAHVQFAVAGGVGEILEGSLAGPAMRTNLQGRISLLDRTMAIKAQVEAPAAGAGAGPAFKFDVTGGWDDVAVIPDAKALIQRSGAAQPLLGTSMAPTRGASALPDGPQ